MKTSYFRASARRNVLASVHAAVLIFALILMQFPTMAIAQEEPPATSPVAETVEVEAPKEDAPADVPADLEEGLTEDTAPPVPADEVTEPPTEPEEVVEPPVVEEETPSDTEEESPAEARMMLFAAPPSSPSEEGEQCVIVSDAATLEGGSASFELSGPYHPSWTAVVDALAKWIWGDNGIVDPVHETTQTFTRTFSIANDAVGGTLIIAADNSYSVQLDGIEISNPADANVEDNYHNNKVDTITIDASALDAGSHTLTFTVKNWAMGGGTTTSNPAGLKYKLSIDGSNCGEPKVETATVIAQKIVCPFESELPNWGAGGADITADTAADFLEQHPACHLEPDWEFEWVTDEDSNTNPGDNSGVAGTPWTLFGADDGLITAEIPAGGKVWIREVMKDGFIPFTGQNTDQNVSAEMYCSTDVLNYDNWDWIDPVKAGEEYHCVAFNAPKTSSVTMCKVNTEEEPLSGWQLTLTGDAVGSVTVEPDGEEHTIEDVGAGSYIATANGQYVYRPGDVNASTSDAAFSLRAPSDPVYGGPDVPWVAVNSFPMPHTGWLGIMLNGQVTDWGAAFNPSHIYVHATTTSTLSDFVFRILDDVYADNSGSLSVDLNRGYTGVTGEDGCVTFDNVPYGTYDAGELLKEGWTTVSGTGKVVVDEPTETFTIVNTDGELPPENAARIVATKVVCDSEEDLPNNEMGKPITAETAQAWVAQSNGACHLESGWEFEWGNQNAGDGGPTTIGHAPNYTTFGATDVNGVATTYVPLDGITTIQMREVLKEGFIPFTNAGDVSAEFYCANDAAGYDNWEWISNPVAGETYHCVAFNAAIDDGGEPTKPDEVTVVVTGDTATGENQPGWLFNRDTSTQSPYAFVLGNAATGTGSLHVQEIGTNPSDKFIGELFLLEKIADINSIMYDFKIGGPSDTVEEQFYMNVYANFGSTSPTNYYDCRYDVVATTGSMAGYTTVTFDPSLNYPVVTRGSSPHPCPTSPAQMDSIGTGSSTIRAIAITVGDTSDSDAGVSGYLDKVVVALTDLITTYDFEPAATPSIIETDGGGGGGSSKKAGRQGEVLGASTAACSPLLSTFMRMGIQNDTTEVIELQGFLNEHMGAMLPLTGVFGPMTDAAVHTFQKKYWEDVLKPWFPYPDAGIADMDDSTGYVYKTTQWKINDIVCPDVAPFPALP